MFINTNDVKLIDETEFRFAGDLTFVLARVGAATPAQQQRPGIGIGRMQHLESSIADECVRVHRQQMSITFPNPGNLDSTICSDNWITRKKHTSLSQ